METFWETFKRHGVSRRDFLRFATAITGLMGLSPSMIPEVVRALETKPRVPVLWIHGLECTCCSESFIRSATPLASDVLLSMISLEYDDTLSAAAGDAIERHREEIMKKYWGNYILAVEGNPPLGEDGMLMMVLCDREGRIYDVWISFGSMHEVRAFRERKKRSLWFRGLVENCVVYGDRGYRGCEGVIVCDSREMRAKWQVVEGVISQIKLFNAGSGWRTLTCVLVYVYAYAIGYSNYRRGELEV